MLARLELIDYWSAQWLGAKSFFATNVLIGELSFWIPKQKALLYTQVLAIEHLSVDFQTWQALASLQDIGIIAVVQHLLSELLPPFPLRLVDLLLWLMLGLQSLLQESCIFLYPHPLTPADTWLIFQSYDFLSSPLCRTAGDDTSLAIPLVPRKVIWIND